MTRNILSLPAYDTKKIFIVLEMMATARHAMEANLEERNDLILCISKT
jgi:hypothetical protein